MKKIIFAVFIFSLFACQEDDVCVDEASPNLVFKVYSASTMEPLFLDTLYVTYRDSDNAQDTLKLYNIDSAQIPLRIDNGAIGFGLIRSLEFPQSDSIAMNYSSKNEYVSKACGLKKIYENVNYQIISQNQLQSIESLTNTISNSNEVHLNLYY